MNKRDLSALRRQFKTESYSLKLKHLYTVYMKKDNQNILLGELASFDMKSQLEQEIYLAGFKKLLTGGLNSKIFELAFEDVPAEDEGQALCTALLDSPREAFMEYCNTFLSKIAANYTYESDIVISFVKGKYDKPVGRKNKKGEEDTGFNDATYGFSFIMCSISKAEDTKHGIYYDASSQRFELNSSLDKTISLASPLEGFMFPAFSNNCSDVNKLVYYTYKANTKNDVLLENILHCKDEPTAKEEQEKFESLLRLVNGDAVRPEVLKNIYDAVYERLEADGESDDPVTLNAADIRDIFEGSGVKNLNGFDEAYIQAADDGYVFKAASLIPGGSGSVKIISGIADISLNLDDLISVRQVINAKGRKCLQIELSEDAAINGIALETERD